MQKLTPIQRFDSWVERKNLHTSKLLNQYKNTFLTLFDTVYSYHWLFKKFEDFEKYSVTKSILPRTRRLIKHNKKSNLTLYSYLLRFGKTTALNKWNSYRNKQAVSGNSLRHFTEKYGDEIGKKMYDEVIEKRKQTKENYCEKYGEQEGLRRWEQYRKKQSYSGCKLEYFIEKYGSEIGKKKYELVNQRKAQTLKNYIEKYGKQEGTKKFNDYWDKLNKNRSLGISKTSQELFNSLSLINEDKTYYHQKNKEFNVFCNYSKDVHMYFYDFVDTRSKKVIEYNGDYWHRNPKTYPPTEENQKIWENDRRKIRFIENLGYEVLIIWESEYLSNKQETIEKCNEFLRNKNNN